MGNLASSLEKELDRLRKIIFQGKYTEAMNGIEEVLETENISIENKIIALNLKSLIEFYLGKFVHQPDRFRTARALDLEAYEESLKIDNPSLLFTSTIFLSWSNYRLSMYKENLELALKLESIYERICSEEPREAKRLEPLFLIFKAVRPAIRSFLGEPVPENYIEESIKQTEKALKLSEEVNDLFARSGAINNLMVFYLRTGRMEEHYSYIIKLLDFWEELGNKYAIASTLGALGHFHLENGEYDLYLDYMSKSLRIWEELENDTGIAIHNSEMGAYYESQRRYNKALECFKKALDYFTEKEDLLRISYISQSIGYVYRLKGDLLQALEYTEKVYDYCYETKYEGWWSILPNLSAIYLLIGDLDKALQFEEENLNLHKKTEYTLETAFSLSRICMIYWQKGFEDKAISDAQKSLRLFEEIENSLWIGNILFDLIFFTSEKSEIELARGYRKRLEQITAETKDSVLKLKLNFSEALILKNSSNSRERLRAELSFENLLREDLAFSFRTRVLISLCELILHEINLTNEVESFENLKKYVGELSSIASDNNSYLLTCQTLILQSKLALVELNKNQAENLLEEAIKIATEVNLDRLKKVIWKEQSNIEAYKDVITKLDSSARITEKLGLLKVENGIKRIKRTTTTESIVDDTPIPLKIHI